MKLYILDTDTVSLHQRGNAKIDYNILMHLIHNDVAATVITFQEQWNGWLAQLRRVKSSDLAAEVYRQMTALIPYFGMFRLVTFDKPAMDQFDALKKLKLGVGSMDLRIAAIALEHGAIVVTRNKVDFQRVPNLTIEDWSQ
mgnify:CR=1 FL=1